MRKLRKQIREDMIKRVTGVIIQVISLLCLVLIVYMIGRTFIVKSDQNKKAANNTTSTTAQSTKESTEDDDIIVTESTVISSSQSTADKNTSTRKQSTTATATSSTQAEISTQYGQETNQDGNDPSWILEQKNVIDMEKDGYDLRSRGKSGIQYIDPNGDVAKVLLQPEDSVDGKSYEEYYYQGDELIYAEIWTDGDNGTDRQYYFNNRTLIQWVDSDGTIYDKDSGADFADNSDWKKYLVSGQTAMKISNDISSISDGSSSESSSSGTSSSSSESSSSSTSSSSTSDDTDSSLAATEE